MYFPYWMMLVGVSLGASIVAFVWALRSGQFQDQGRARYLALRDAAPGSEAAESPRPAVEVYVLLFAAGMALAGLVVAALLSILTLRG
jgi:cbb3-type cytochrome oxidase maturation protein